MVQGLKPHYYSVSAAILSLFLISCSSTNELSEKFQQSQTPVSWSEERSNADVLLNAFDVNHDWLAQLETPQIHQFVALALDKNLQLKQQVFAVEIQKQQLIVSGSSFWPSLDLSLKNSRRKLTPSTSYSSSASLDLNLQYELDIWGKLSDADRQSNLEYMALKASFEQAKQQLVADVVIAWFAVIEANQLTRLYKQRTDNTKQNLAIIESGYQQGLNSALDVYLTRNEVNNELSRTTDQINNQKQTIRQLERLLGKYPAGTLIVEADLPLLNSEIPLGLPAELISRKPSLMASWYQLLAKDSALAFAHKQRFPSLTLSASLGDSGNDLGDLLSASTLGWSLLGNLTSPIFNAGKLEANEEQSRLALKQSEQGYLDTLQSAFSDVENAVARESSLKQRYQMMVKAQENAIAAQTLSFEQYQSGLVDYPTVLDAQSRSYDAQSTVIQIKNQLLANRIKLYLALGGDFSSAAVSDKTE